MVRAFKDSETQEQETKRQRIFWKIFDTVVAVTFLVAIILYEDNKLNTWFWWTFATIFSYAFLIKMVRVKELKRLVPYFDIRLYIGSVLIVLPIACFSIGKLTSLNIYHNQSIMTLKVNTDKGTNETLKLLGFIGDKVIVSSLDNKRVIFINQTSKDQIEILKK